MRLKFCTGPHWDLHHQSDLSLFGVISTSSSVGQRLCLQASQFKTVPNWRPRFCLASCQAFTQPFCCTWALKNCIELPLLHQLCTGTPLYLAIKEGSMTSGWLHASSMLGLEQERSPLGYLLAVCTGTGKRWLCRDSDWCCH